MLYVLSSGGIRGDDRAGVDLEIIPDPKFRRLKATVDIALAVKLYYTSQYARLLLIQFIAVPITLCEKRFQFLNCNT